MKLKNQEPQCPDTCYEREMGIKAFRTIVLKTLLEIEGVYFLEENIVDSILGREGVEGVRGIEIEVDPKQPILSVNIRICLASGLVIPQKVEEIQTKVVEDLTADTGLHVARVLVVVEDVKLPEGWIKKLQERLVSAMLPEKDE